MKMLGFILRDQKRFLWVTMPISFYSLSFCSSDLWPTAYVYGDFCVQISSQWLLHARIRAHRFIYPSARWRILHKDQDLLSFSKRDHNRAASQVGLGSPRALDPASGHTHPPHWRKVNSWIRKGYPEKRSWL